MGLKIYNSLTNQIEEFVPIQPGKVNMYVCGPTVYNHIHIGNARPVVFFDMMKNYLEYLGYEVHYASNITDIDDKIINQAIAENKTEKEVAGFYEKSYFEAVEKLGSTKPEFIPHATEYISEMISFIGKLIEEGYAYEVDGDVFFRVKKVSNYGCLSNQVSDDLEQGARISINEKKENPLDFALWKKTEVGIKWKSPFGEGRPGWHTECVVMNHKLFGDQIDIHGGGMDLKFPHHENEIAQNEALYHNSLAKYWMHVGRLEFEGQKMSKSLHNVIYVKDLENNKSGMILRMVLVFTPYRNNFSYSQEIFDQYEKIFDKWQRAYKQGLYELQLMNIKNGSFDVADMHEFEEYMNQDFNVQNVMMLLERITKELNVSIRSKNKECIVSKWHTMNKILHILGINLFVHPMEKVKLEVYRKWNAARQNKEFEVADTYRRQLVDWGIL
ncbi:MAG: cysteine--tRNA ligase [Roseburia sp.]|nr:cysteine--tRNA ligase [Anaeroplasma bactoclasticum]MCM1195679.1 cysteine--tRNA ligase [Roseburia sp.]MCM1556136.1 cysteine--tRNA ligase [Anaeroplasma bactoclasticum]